MLFAGFGVACGGVADRRGNAGLGDGYPFEGLTDVPSTVTWKYSREMRLGRPLAAELVRT